jgi:hypothetical protein
LVSVERHDPELAAPHTENPAASTVAMHTGGLTPTVARRLLYGIVAACVALTAGVALLRPAPPAATGPQHPVVILPELPFAVPEQSGSTQVVIVPMDGGWAQSIRMGSVGIPVHGLPGQVGASP